MVVKINLPTATYNKILDLFSVHKKTFIAYSGGLDSHALLHIMANLCQSKKDVKLTAIHVNHNLSPKSKQWAKHCQKVCKNLGVAYITKSIDADIKSDIHSPEEILRKLRYEIFAKILPENGCILTAHQANDQAETLLLQLFRGAGPKGLAAMPEKIKFAQGFLARPLLNLSREEILQYAQKNKLKWVEDESNVDTKFDRNLIRHKLIPAIKKRWPGIVATLNRVASHCAEANELLEILAKKDLQDIAGKDVQNTLDIKLFKKLDFIRQKNTLRFWLHKLQLPMPSNVKLNEVIRTVINSRYDAMPVVKWFGVEIRRFRDHLYAMPPLTSHDKSVILSFLKKTLKLPAALGTLKVSIKPGFKLDLKKTTVCFRQGGEKINLPKRGTHDLKKLMQEWKIPVWLRDRIPLIYYDNKIIAVVGYWSVDSVRFQLITCEEKSSGFSNTLTASGVGIMLLGDGSCLDSFTSLYHTPRES
ncbi:MAG TPA: tRNA lysidine(34) synthetase TilS [Coxiellaceae bacterium]|nr:tRNA lysidine(34) synthetase TilS [Coxiellaceae bacterium]